MDSEEIFKEWDEENYRLLNAHFRQQINELLRTDPFLADALAGGKNLQLQELISRLSENDQRLWQEFLALDRTKLHLDMNNHLEGRGNPYSPCTGFHGPSGPQVDIGDPW